jgi:apolipoprotein N-acyltransferase
LKEIDQMATLTHSQTKPQTLVRADLLRLGLGVFLSALGGVMLLLSFPPYGIWPFAWIGFVPYLFAQYRLMPFKWSSLAVALANLLWLGPFLAKLFGTEIGFFFTYLGVWIAILSLLISRDRNFHELTHYRWLVLSGILSFVGFEMIRATFIPLVATSAFIGYTQAKQAWLIQPISIFSVYGFDLLILLVNYSIALGVIAWFDRHWRSADVTPVDVRMAWKWLAIAGGVLGTWIILSVVMLNSAASMPKVRVAALRPNFPLPAFQDEVNTSQVRFDVFAGQAREAAAQGAQVLYTPEMMFNFDPQVEFTEQFRAVAKETGAYIFITYTVAKEGEPWRNEAVLLTPQGEFLDVYGKNHAFGEPPTAMKGVFPVYDTPLGRLATLICHDGNYTDVTRKLAGNGAQIVAAPIHEFGGFGEQYWTNVLFRAVENRTAMVVTGVSTVSAIINPDGSLVALDTNADGSRLTLVGDVTLGTHNALYTSLGDVLGWVSMAGFVFFIFFQSVVQKKAKKAVQN